MKNDYTNSTKTLNQEFWDLTIKRYAKAYWECINFFKKNGWPHQALTKPENADELFVMLDSFFLCQGIEMKANEFAHPLTGRIFVRYDYFEVKNPMLQGKFFSGMPILAEQADSVIFFKYIQAFEVLEQKLTYHELSRNHLQSIKHIHPNSILGVYHRLAQAS